VEAEARSGSLITARYAGEQGREVFAIPGSPLDPRAAGPNSLIRDGARLTTGPHDVIDALRDSAGFGEREADAFAREPAPLQLSDALAARVAALLSPVPASLEDLARDTGLPWRTVAAVIVELELAGRAVTQPGGLVCAAL
jgi:DNA processing protein